MREWKIDRVATLDDGVLINKLNEIQRKGNTDIKEIIFIGNNSLDVRIYQIIYLEG